MKNVCVALLAALLAAGVVSCGEKRMEEAYRNEMGRLEQMATEGDPAGAMEVLAAMVDAKPFRQHRIEILNRLVSFACMTGDTDAAVKYFRAGVESAPAGMEGMMGTMIDTLSARKAGEPFVEWCVSLDGVVFGAGTRQALCMAHAKALCDLGRGGEALQVFEKTMGAFPAADAMNLARTMFGFLTGAGWKKEAGEVPAIVERAVPESSERRGLLCDLRLALLIADGRTEEALTLFRGELAGIPDGNLVSGMQALAKALPDGGDKLSEEVMTACVKRTDPRKAAARIWIRNIRDRKDVPGMAARLAALREKGFPDAFVASQMETVYSEFIGMGDAQSQARVYALFEAILKDAGDEDLKRRVAAYLLDIGFFLEKYAESLALVESGIFREDERVASGELASKIKGHLALQQGRIDDAVRHFREFMTLIGKRMSGRQMDPLDNTWVTRDMVLGLNAKRIGDILGGAGRAQDAAKAYGEAREYYEKALKDFPDKESKEHRKIQASLSAIPKG